MLWAASLLLVIPAVTAQSPLYGQCKSHLKDAILLSCSKAKGCMQAVVRAGLVLLLVFLALVVPTPMPGIRSAFPAPAAVVLLPQLL